MFFFVFQSRFVFLKFRTHLSFNSLIENYKGEEVEKKGN